MTLTRITTVKALKDYLYVAMKLEHATIPPYLLALYSIHPGTNPDATHILRTVVVEEMLHLTLAANILNAVGGKPTLLTKDFVPTYPTPLPDGEDFTVDLQRFSEDAIKTFLNIERPSPAPTEEERVRRRPGVVQSFVSEVLDDPELHFYSIGEFYREIERGINHLAETMPAKELFCGLPEKQVPGEYYYSGGGELFTVHDKQTACAAIDLICGQGEGFGGDIYDEEHELAHYYRFQQLLLGQYYQPGDKPDTPSGPALTVEWDATYPIALNPKVAQYGDSELRTAAVAFNESYAKFLGMLTEAYNGKPQLLLDAVPQMFRLRDKMLQLIHNPIPDNPKLNAGPTFEVAPFLEVKP